MNRHKLIIKKNTVLATMTPPVATAPPAKDIYKSKESENQAGMVSVRFIGIHCSKIQDNS